MKDLINKLGCDQHKLTMMVSHCFHLLVDVIYCLH
jgi:hypothetical protein